MPLTVHADHVRLSVRLTPNADRDGIGGVETDAAGERFLKAKVRALPENGKANKALVELLARHFGVARSAVHLVSGETARKKILRIMGDPEDIGKKL
jgi:uncharacterized protein (TIGR00251 family)